MSLILFAENKENELKMHSKRIPPRGAGYTRRHVLLQGSSIII